MKLEKKEKAKREAIQDWLFLCTSKQAQIFNMSEQNTAEDSNQWGVMGKQAEGCQCQYKYNIFLASQC